MNYLLEGDLSENTRQRLVNEAVVGVSSGSHVKMVPLVVLLVTLAAVVFSAIVEVLSKGVSRVLLKQNCWLLSKPLIMLT
ncbi:hypothetical protein ACOSQ2_030255 [Xanthoceras sorbifolium]